MGEIAASCFCRFGDWCGCYQETWISIVVSLHCRTCIGR